MKNDSEIRSLLGQVKQAAEKLKGKINGLDDQIEALYARRNVLLSGALSKVDYLATIRADVQAKARFFRMRMLKHLHEGDKINYPSMARAAEGLLPLRYLDAGQNMAVPMPEEAFYFYFEDAILAGMDRLLEGHTWPTDSIPASDRGKALKEINAQIAALTKERDTMADDLVSCGVTQ
jgi:hypothetical protein